MVLMDRNKGLVLPGERVSQIVISSAGKNLLSSHGKVLRVNLNNKEYSEQGKYLLVLEFAEHHKLTELPTEIGQLQNLEVLYLFGNHLSELPK